MASSATNRPRIIATNQRSLLRQRARRMRHEPTQSEWLVWQAIRMRRLGGTFRRQVVLQGYIADFYASAAKLIVEVDGSSHARRYHADQRRDRVLSAAGYRVLRVSDSEVLTALPAVLVRIRAALAE